MRPWESELARKIAALSDEDWERRLYVVSPSAETAGVEIPVKEFSVEIGPGDVWLLVPLVGTVNDRECAGVGPGCLLFSGYEFRFDEPNVGRFALRKWSWNQFLVDGRWREMVDSVGNQLYPPADFSAIP